MARAAALSAILALGACESMSGSAEHDFEGLKAAAVASIDKAKASGNEWRDSRKILTKAEDAFKAGDIEKAIKLAKKAKEQGELAVAQAAAQANAGPM